MPKKPAELKVQENTAPKIDPQKQYLMDQFGNLMEQVGDGFGGPLQEELISRLEQTIADFHEEVNEMLGRLKDNSSELSFFSSQRGFFLPSIKLKSTFVLKQMYDKFLLFVTNISVII